MTCADKPLVIAVAPNGARYSRADHPELPLTTQQLAQTALACLEAGARMIHLHVRDSNNKHSIQPQHYLPALEAVKEAVGDEMIVQVTSEAAGIYSSSEQIQLMTELMPDCVSVALRELVPDDGKIEPFKEFIHCLTAKGCLLQYILYDETDFERYQNMILTGVIPEGGHSVLYVLGRYTKSAPTLEIVSQYKSILTTEIPIMVCTFGANGNQILARSVELGTHARIGFENGFYLPNGDIARDNAQLIEQSIRSFESSGRKLASLEQARVLLGQELGQ